MSPESKYIFEPYQFLQQGQPIMPSLSLPFTILDSTLQGIMFQNTSNEPIHLKRGQVLGRATTGATEYTSNTAMIVDWADLIQPGARNHFLGSTAPKLISTSFYDWPIAETFQSLNEELNFLANTIHYTGMEEPRILLSEMLTFNALGKELLKSQPIIINSTRDLPQLQSGTERLPRTISEEELLKKIALAPRRQPGEQRDAENEDEAPPFAPIPDRQPSDPIEAITESDIRMGKELTRK